MPQACILLLVGGIVLLIANGRRWPLDLTTILCLYLGLSTMAGSWQVRDQEQAFLSQAGSAKVMVAQRDQILQQQHFKRIGGWYRRDGQTETWQIVYIWTGELGEKLLHYGGQLAENWRRQLKAHQRNNSGAESAKGALPQPPPTGGYFFTASMVFRYCPV